MDLPCEDDAAGLVEYADAAMAAIGDRDRNTSWWSDTRSADSRPRSCAGGWTPTSLVLVQGMIPVPGETPG